ncbi:MAG: M1 family aminopeptidase [Planctomycetota bacterium]|nr:M1 family aminopeptidase [Planctomycetota bacterium]
MLRILAPCLALCVVVAAQDKAPPLDASTRDFTQKHLEIHIKPDIAAGEVAGRIRITFESLVDGLEVLRLHSKDTTLEGVKDGDGNQLQHALKDGILSITLAAPLPEGAPGMVEITYKSKPKHGLYFHHPQTSTPNTPVQMYSQGQSSDNRRWIPMYDEPDDRCTWDLHVTVEKGLDTISNGELAEQKDNGDGTRTDHWQFDSRSPTYLISLIVGKFERIRQKHEDVVLEYNGPPGRAEELQTALGETPAMMKIFGEYLDEPYPWRRYAQTFVWDFVYGGMENTTATTLNMRALHRLAARPNYSSEGLVAHELAHMWFGDLMTCRTWHHIWLNEGFATYMTDLYFEAKYGREEFLLRRRRQNGGYRSGTPHPENLKLEKDPRGDRPLELHGGKQYSRGAAILHMLRLELGDELFRDAIRHYVDRFRDKPVTSENLRIAVEEKAGRDLKWFWSQWVYGAGYPVLKVRRDAEAGTVTVEQVQVRKGAQGLFRLRLPVRIGETGPVQYLDVYRDKHKFEVEGEGEYLRVGVGGDMLIVVKLEQSQRAWTMALVTDPDVCGRLDAALALEEYGAAAVPAYVEALQRDKSWAVRKQAAEILGRIDADEAVAALLQAVYDKDTRVQEAVFDAFGRKRRDQVERDLLVWALQTESPYVRAAAARTIGRLKVQGAYELLTELLASPSHRNVVREGALKGLRLLGDPRGAEAAAAYLKYDAAGGGTHQARKAAIDCVTALAPDEIATQRQLVALLDDPFHRMRSWAAGACGKYGVRRAIPKLRKLAESDPFKQVKKQAKTALKRLGVPYKPKQKDGAKAKAKKKKEKEKQQPATQSG